MFEFAHWLRKIIQLSILTFSRRQTLFKNIQMYLKREAQNLFWSGMLDMFSLYNSFLSLKSKQRYLNSKYCCSSDLFFFIVWLMNLKIFMTNDFLFAFAIYIYIYICICFFFDEPNMAQMFGSKIYFLELDHLYSHNCKLVLTLGFIFRVIDWTLTWTHLAI